MAQPLLSVAVITYNQEKFISQTLDSILNQEHPFSYEIVIGEDCSTDGTKAIIEKYVAKYPDVIKPLFNNPNKGLIANYYNVLSQCSGKYIMECAGDDYWLPGKVEKQIKYLEDHPDIGMCYGKTRIFDEQLKKFGKSLFGSKKESFYELLNGNNIPALTTCFRKEIVLKYINEIDPINKQWMMEDYPLWLWISKNSKIHFFEKEVFGVYRNITGSVSHISDLDKNIAFQKNCIEVATFFAEKYGVSYSPKENDRFYFEICYSLLLNSYSRQAYINLYKSFQKLKNKTLKDYFICIISYFPFLIKIKKKIFS